MRVHLALLALCLTLLACAGGAQAAAPAHDLRGTWSCVYTAGGTCTFEITDMNMGTGVFSGHGEGNNFTWPVSGTLDGSSLTMTHGPYKELPSYTAKFTGQVTADGTHMIGTFGSGGGGGSPFDYPRTSAAPPTTPTPPTPVPTPTPEPTDPDCANPTVLLVKCAELRRPTVCGPTASILPACYFPTPLPTVCGPSGTILTPCQSKGPYVVACGGMGTILPPCNLPPPRLPQVCGPSGTILPPCQGFNNPIVVCGPSGTILPQCNFSTKIDVKPIDLEEGTGEVSAIISCPAPLAAPTVSSSQKETKELKPRCPPGTFDLMVARQAARESLAPRIAFLTNFVRIAAGLYPDNYTPDLVKNVGNRNAGIFLTRVNRILDRYLGETSDDEITPALRSKIGADLADRGGSPPYVQMSGYGYSSFLADVETFSQQLEVAVNTYIRTKRISSHATPTRTRRSADPTRMHGPAVVTRFQLRVGQRKTVRMRLGKRIVRQLGREAHGARFVGVRLYVTFAAKPRPVVRFFDARLPIKKQRKH